MAHYIAYASKSRAAQHRELMAEVISMLEAAIWAIPHTTELGPKLVPGDGLIVAVGASYRRFVANAIASFEVA
jgi:hypothetical protein